MSLQKILSKTGGESDYVQMHLSAVACEIITEACSCFTWLPCCEIPTPSFMQANEEAPKRLSEIPSSVEIVKKSNIALQFFVNLFKVFDTVDHHFS